MILFLVKVIIEAQSKSYYFIVLNKEPIFEPH